LLLDLKTHVVEHECEFIGCHIKTFGGTARAVSGSGLYPDDHWIFSHVFLLQCSSELKGVGWYDSIIMVGGGHKGGRVRNAAFDVV
jgi:hypothetical protein